MEGRKDYKGNRNENRNENKNDSKKVCTNCGQEGHLLEQCFERLGYPEYKGKMAKKNNILADQVNCGFDEHFNGDTLFDNGCENEVGMSQSGLLLWRSLATISKP